MFLRFVAITFLQELIHELFDRLDNLVDVIIDTGEETTYEVSTILDLTGDEPMITRRGLGWEAAAAWV